MLHELEQPATVLAGAPDDVGVAKDTTHVNGANECRLLVLGMAWSQFCCTEEVDEFFADSGTRRFLFFPDYASVME